MFEDEEKGEGILLGQMCYYERAEKNVANCICINS